MNNIKRSNKKKTNPAGGLKQQNAKLTEELQNEKLQNELLQKALAEANEKKRKYEIMHGRHITNTIHGNKVFMFLYFFICFSKITIPTNLSFIRPKGYVQIEMEEMILKPILASFIQQQLSKVGWLIKIRLLIHLLLFHQIQH